MILWMGLSAGAQMPRPGDPEYTAQGRLVIVRVVPKDRTAKLFFVGKKAAELDLKKDHKVLSVTAIGPGSKSEQLSFQGEGDAYTVSQIPDWSQPYDLSIMTETRGQKDELKVKIENGKTVTK